MGFTTLATANYVMKVEFIGRDADTDLRVQYPNVFLYSLRFQEIQASVTELAHNITLPSPIIIELQSINLAFIQMLRYRTTVGDFIKAVERACNKYEEELSNTEQGNPQPRKHWKISLAPELTAILVKTNVLTLTT